MRVKNPQTITLVYGLQQRPCMYYETKAFEVILPPLCSIHNMSTKFITEQSMSLNIILNDIKRKVCSFSSMKVRRKKNGKLVNFFLIF